MPPPMHPSQAASHLQSVHQGSNHPHAGISRVILIHPACHPLNRAVNSEFWRAGTTATLTSDPFQPGPTASASFSASVHLPGYFPVLPATSSAVLVNNGDPDDPGKCPCLVMTLRGSQLLRPRLQVHAGACAHRLRPAVACSAACPCSRTTALGQTTQRRPVC